MMSTPAAKNASASFGVIPMPPAAFSPLTTTKVGSNSSRSTGSSASTVRLPVRATTSPTNRIEVLAAIGAGRYRPRGAYLVAMPTLPDPSQAPPARVGPVVLPRWVQLVLLPLAILGVVAIMRAAGPVLLLFIVAGLIALLLNPFVTVLRRLRFPRGLAVLAVMLCVVLFVVWIGFLLANPVADQVSSFQRNVPGIVDDANATLADFQDWLDRNGIDVQVKDEGQTALQTLGKNLSRGSGELVSFTSDALQILVEASIALVLVVVLSVYMLLYGERIGAFVRSIMPRGDGTPEDDFPTRIQAAVFGYVRGQLLFSLIMGTSAGVLLWILAR